jgi:hypothetical protein
MTGVGGGGLGKKQRFSERDARFWGELVSVTLDFRKV